MKTFSEMIDCARKKGPIKMAVAAAADMETLKAVQKAQDLGLVKAILTGDVKHIETLLSSLSFTPYDIVDGDNNSADTAVALVRKGQADILMKGLVNTGDFMRSVLHKRDGLSTGRLLSMLAVFELPNFPKLIFTADSGINIAPNLEEKRMILMNSLEVLKQLGITRPYVAVLSANEKISKHMLSTVHAAELVAMAARDELPPCIIEGPMALDVVFSAEAAVHKGIVSQVSGRPDLLLYPNIESGNILAKSWIHFLKTPWAGTVLGAKVPIVLGSRSDEAIAKINSIALACIQTER